jgi:hypothetical protein
VVARAVLDWLLEPDQPAIRYAVLRDLEHRSPDDGELQAARSAIPRQGWAAEILGKRSAGGWWVQQESLYTPKYLSTNWMMLLLADLGLDRPLPAVRASSELWIERARTEDGGFSGSGGRRGHLCTTGNEVRALIQLGYVDHPAVRSGLDWLVRNASPLGGWSCWGSGRNLDSWEGLSAFAAYPRERWTASMQATVDRACEFFLERELLRQGDPYPPWRRLHYPVHYYYDVLVGLDLLTALGHAGDPRLKAALGLLRRKRGRDGRWRLDALHPDVEGPVAAWFKAHPKRAPVPFGLERPGAPSKMITLRALRVLDRIEGTS